MKLKYLLFTIILLLIVIIYYIFSKKSYFISNIENLQPYPNDQAKDVSTIDNFRTFLEQLHVTASKDEVSDASYNFCSKVKNLATYINPIIGSIKNQSISTIFKTYGAAANPTPGPISPPTEPPLPIVNNFYDYIQLLTLVVRGSMLLSLSNPDVNINNKLDLIGKDTIENAYNIGLVDCANAQFIPIRNIIEYFHNQKSNKDPTPGDTYNTALVYDSCDAIIAAAPKLSSKPYSIFKQPNNTFFGNIPKWASRIRVLIIGAGGGGGGGGYGCSTSRSRVRDNGGGGGSSGNTGVAICSDMISVTPGTQYNVLIGAGGAAGNVTKPGYSGGRTYFSYNRTLMLVLGGDNGLNGNNGTCGRNTGYGGKTNRKGLMQRHVYKGTKCNIVANTVYGNEGGSSDVQDSLSNTKGGYGGNSVTINSVDNVIKSMLQDANLTESELLELQQTSGLNNVHLNCGFGGKGGNGNSGDFKKPKDGGGFELLPPSPGSAGGSGYVLVVYYE